MPVRPILEITEEMRDVFAQYELTRKELSRTDELIDKLKNRKITVSVIGQFKRGKSLLTNTILNENVMPVGIVPVTAVVTSVKYGEKKAVVKFDNGISKEIAFEDLHLYINEQENYDNHLGVREVDLYCPSEFLIDGLTLVDTPGVGSVHQKNSDEAYSFVKESDAVLFVLSVDSPINQIEVDFLMNAKEYASKFYFVINKVDTVSDEDLGAFLSYARKQLCRIMGAEDVQMYSVSAKTGQGIDELKYVIKHDCKTKVKDIIDQSAKLKMKDIGASALSQISLYRTTLQMTHKQFDETFEELEHTFNDLKKEAEEFVPQFKSNPKMLEAELNNIKNALSDRVSSLFRIDFYYDISSIDFFRGGTVEEDGSRNLTDYFLGAVQGIFDDLRQTIGAIFMYREENAFTVTQRIYDVNKLTRRLVRLRTELDRTESEQAEIDKNKKPEFIAVHCE